MLLLWRTNLYVGVRVKIKLPISVDWVPFQHLKWPLNVNFGRKIIIDEQKDNDNEEKKWEVVRKSQEEIERREKKRE